MIENINRTIENGYAPRESPLYNIQRKSASPIVERIQRQIIEGSKPNIKADFETSLNQAKEGQTIQQPQDLNPIQGKLTIGQPGDKYEQEADEVAAQVVQRINEPQTPSTNNITNDQGKKAKDDDREYQPFHREWLCSP